MDERLTALRKEYREKNEPILRDETLKILLKLIKDKRPEKVLEIGTSVGLTTTAILLESDSTEITSIEKVEEKVITAKSHLKLFGVEKRAKLIVGDADEIIPILTGEYDFIFLDGPKGQYLRYLPDLLSVLKVGGTLFADDISFHGYIEGETPKKHRTIKNSLTGFLERLKSDKSLRTEIIDIEDGISVSEKIR